MALLPVNISSKSQSYKCHLRKGCGWVRGTQRTIRIHTSTARCSKHVFIPCQTGNMKQSKRTETRYGSGSAKYIFRPLGIHSLRSFTFRRKSESQCPSLLFSTDKDFTELFQNNREIHI